VVISLSAGDIILDKLVLQKCLPGKDCLLLKIPFSTLLLPDSMELVSNFFDLIPLSYFCCRCGHMPFTLSISRRKRVEKNSRRTSSSISSQGTQLYSLKTVSLCVAWDQSKIAIFTPSCLWQDLIKKITQTGSMVFVFDLFSKQTRNTIQYVMYSTCHLKQC